MWPLHDPTSEIYSDSYFRCTKCKEIKISRVKGYPTKYRDYGLCKNCSGYPWGIIHGVERNFKKFNFKKKDKK